MAKSAAEERRELNAAVAVLLRQVDTQEKTLAEVRAEQHALAKTFTDFRVEAAVWRTESLSLARDFAEYKRRAELREQRLWQLGIGLVLALVGVTATVTAAIIRRQP